MAIAKSTLKALESSIRVVSRELAKHAKDTGRRGAALTGYELRQSLLLLTKSRAAFEPDLGPLSDGAGDLIGFQSADSEDEEDSHEAGLDVPEARAIGFKPRA